MVCMEIYLWLRWLKTKPNFTYPISKFILLGADGVLTVVIGLNVQLHHTAMVPSAPPLTNHGCRLHHLTWSTPSPSRISWPRRIFKGTIKGSVMRSLYTLEWNIWIAPSSDEEAKSGYVGWKWSERMARVWYLNEYKIRLIPDNRNWIGPHNFVGFVAKFQIEPTQLSVVSSNDEVVARWMNIHGRYPFYPRYKGLQKLLFRKIVNPHVLLRLRKSISWHA